MNDSITPSENARLAVELEEQARSEPEWVNYRRTWKALMLATTPDVWIALLDGQSVPISRLDPEWAARFGRR
jgi:hypothetical protein